jgi:hypothetical protein
VHRIPALVLRHRAALDRAALAAAIALPLVCAAAALVVDDWRARRFLLAYVAPFFVALPLWVRRRLARAERWSGPEMALDGAVVTLGALRFAGGFLPFSGHALFFAYSFLTVPSRGYRLLAALLLAETAYFKLVVRSDPHSLALGTVLALAFAALHRRITR